MRPERRLCRPCGSVVIHAKLEDGEVVVLELHESPLGPDRFAVWDDGTARPVPAKRVVSANPLHRCPSEAKRNELS